MKDLKNRFDVLATGAEDTTRALAGTRDAVRDFGAQLDAMRGAMDGAAAAFTGGGASGAGGIAAEFAAPSAEDSGFGKLGAQMGSMASRLGSALKGAFVPMQTAAGNMNVALQKIAHTVDVVGGTFVTFARRVDTSMKTTPVTMFWQWLAKEAKGSLGGMVAENMLAMRKFGMAWHNMGDVAGKTLSEMEGKGRISVLGLIRAFATLKPAMAASVGAALVGGIAAIAPTAFAATKGLLSLANAGLKLMGIKPYRVISLMINPLKLAGFLLRNTTSGMSAFAKVTSAATGPVRAFGTELASALGLFGLAYKVVDFFKGGVTGAVSLNETLNKTNETFGKSSGEIKAMADQLAKVSGASKAGLLDAASSFGLIAQGAGLAEAPAAKLSAELTRLAQDATSFFNVPVDQVLEDLRSGLVGQSEPLRKYGVLLSEDAVAAQAVAMGLAQSTKAVSDQAKVQARAAIIMRGMAPAMGDLERTSDSAANQFRKAGGGLSNFATSIGQVLMPAVDQGVQAFNTLLGSIIETFEANKPLIESWGAKITEVFAGLGVFARNLGTYWQIAQLQVGAFVENAVRTLATIPANAAQYADYFFNNWKKVLSDLAGVWASFYGDLAKNAANFAQAIFTYLRDPTKGFIFQFDFTNLTNSFKQATEQLPELIKPELVSVQDQIDKLNGDIIDKETKRLLNAKPAAERAKRPGPLLPEEADKGKRGHVETAGALELGSREAASAIAKARNGVTDAAIKEARQQTKIQQQIAANTKPQKPAGLPVQFAPAGLHR